MLPPLAKLQYMLFDWDGTLADNAAVVKFALGQTLAEYGLPALEQMQDKYNHQVSLWDNFANLFGADAEAAYARYVQIYMAATPKMVRSFNGAAQLLDFCHNQGVELMIMTNKDRRLLDIELPMLYRSELFSRIVCGHEAPRDKPSPEHIFYTLRGLLSPAEINPVKVWMVGDSNQDSDCALAAGALPLRVNQPLFAAPSYISSQVRYYKDFAELLKTLEENNRD